MELFFDAAAKSTPLDATFVKGSHGVPATAARHCTALICSSSQGAVSPDQTYGDIDVKRISLELMRAGEW